MFSLHDMIKSHTGLLPILTVSGYAGFQINWKYKIIFPIQNHGHLQRFVNSSLKTALMEHRLELNTSSGGTLTQFP